EQVLASLASSEIGLSSAEAARRLAQDGPNELREAEPISAWKIFFAQFKSLIIWILIAAAVVSGLLGEVADAVAILAIVVLNAAIGFYQEFSAEKSIAALKRMTAPRAKVRRDGMISTVPATEIVAGDVLELEAGDLVAADARLLAAFSLQCVESALTGESDTVEKNSATLAQHDLPLADRANMIFMGTSVANGTGRAVVVATGMQTEIGRIAALIHEAGAEEATPLQKKLESLGRVLVWASLGIVAVLFVLGLLRHTPAFEMFLTSVSLAVAAVPEGLPAVVTIALALGVLRMSRRHALVRRLPSVETLGSTSVICTDKTGTLTRGEMTVRALYVAGKTFEVTGEGYEPDGEVRFEGKAVDARQVAPLLELADVLIGCNNAHLVVEDGHWQVIGDPTEGATLSVAQKIGANKEELEHDFPRHHEIPFDSDRKRRTVIRRLPNEQLRAFVNGAPELLLNRCTHFLSDEGVRPLTPADRAAIVATNLALAQCSLRVLGSAYRDLDLTVPTNLSAEEVERDLTFVGLTGMYDPPRSEVKEAVAKCRAAGVRVIMITGDHPQTAMAIAHELGIAQQDEAALAGPELEKLSDRDLQERAARIAVYARVTAEHKLRIIRAWKANGAIVAMTGDGVNDAPAIKGADIGIAMGRTGTEVAKQASDMIIADDNFTSIVAAVEEGRGIYDNIRKTLQYLLAGNTGELLLMTVCVAIGFPAPLLPIHLLWINLVTDGLPALCLATDPIEADVMKRAPRPGTERMTDGRFLNTMLLTGILTAAVSFAVYLHALRSGTIELARTYAFAALVFAELLRSFGARSAVRPIWRIRVRNFNLFFVVAASIAIQLWSHHSIFLAGFLKTARIPLSTGVALLFISSLPLVILELRKVMQRAHKPTPQS
ncbi:MAG: cation-translocating P-type ATPase, partial [Chthoniobacterales bacterium]